MSEGSFGNPEIVEVETDVLIVGGGMAACGAAYEAVRWAGDDVRVTLVRQGCHGSLGCGSPGLVSNQHLSWGEFARGLLPNGVGGPDGNYPRRPRV